MTDPDWAAPPATAPTTTGCSGLSATQTNSDGTTSNYAYQARAFHALTSVTDENGNTTSYGYDSSGP